MSYIRVYVEQVNCEFHIPVVNSCFSLVYFWTPFLSHAKKRRKLGWMTNVKLYWIWKGLSVPYRVNIPVLISKDYEKARMNVRTAGVPTDLKRPPSEKSTASQYTNVFGFNCHSRFLSTDLRFYNMTESIYVAEWIRELRPKKIVMERPVGDGPTPGVSNPDGICTVKWCHTAEGRICLHSELYIGCSSVSIFYHCLRRVFFVDSGYNIDQTWWTMFQLGVPQHREQRVGIIHSAIHKF